MTDAGAGNAGAGNAVAQNARAGVEPASPASDLAPQELLSVLRSREREVRARRRAARTEEERALLGELSNAYDALVRVVAHHSGCSEECVATREDIGPFARGFLAGDSRCLTVAEVAGALGARGRAGGRPAGG